LETGVCIARIDEIATWWKESNETKIEVNDVAENEFRVAIDGPRELTILTRGVSANISTTAWAGSYDQIQTNQFTVISNRRRPFIGLAPTASSKLADFLRQQGYIIEYSSKRDDYSYYFDQAQFVPRHKRFTLAQIEGTNFPLVRLGRWPNGTRSALSVTGDVDAITFWDYFVRLFGK
jgi:sRNA-binding carbon storage regulator CsrA